MVVATAVLGAAVLFCTALLTFMALLLAENMRFLRTSTSASFFVCAFSKGN